MPIRVHGFVFTLLALMAVGGCTGSHKEFQLVGNDPVIITHANRTTGIALMNFKLTFDSATKCLILQGKTETMTAIPVWPLGTTSELVDNRRGVGIKGVHFFEGDEIVLTGSASDSSDRAQSNNEAIQRCAPAVSDDLMFIVIGSSKVR